mmetsp:Transcript_17183/g.27864  ORF Transcript_17183/g.27864 Transcript_17183/m.27864 type:complete len:488 (+) Transcript_17183:117-1580(+)
MVFGKKAKTSSSSQLQPPGSPQKRKQHMEREGEERLDAQEEGRSEENQKQRQQPQEQREEQNQQPDDDRSIQQEVISLAMEVESLAKESIMSAMSYFSRNQDDEEEYGDDGEDGRSKSDRSHSIGSTLTVSPNPGFGQFLIPNILFFIGATIYLWGAYTSPLKSDDDSTETGAAASPAVVFDYDQDQVWFRANADRSVTSSVTHSMAYSFAAMLTFGIVGLWNLSVGCCRCRCCGSDGSDSAIQLIIHALWIVAALWGMASAALRNKDENWSLIVVTVAAHLFALAALLQFVVRLCCQANSNHYHHIRSCTLLFLLRIADLFLVWGTILDTVICYILLLGDTSLLSTAQDVHIWYMALGAAAGWWMSSLLYVLVYLWQAMAACCAGISESSASDRRHRRQKDEEAKEIRELRKYYEEDDDDSDDGLNRASYLPNNVALKNDPTADTANDDASVSNISFCSFWSAGPSTKDAITKSSLDNIFGGSTRR